MCDVGSVIHDQALHDAHFSGDSSKHQLKLCFRPSLVGPATKSHPVCLECLNILQRETSVECANCGFPLCGDRPECLRGRIHARECAQLARLEKRVHLDWESSDNLAYAAVFPLRAMNLREDDPDEMKEVDLLLSGDTKDLRDSFGLEVAAMVITMMGKEGSGVDEEKAIREEVLRIMGLRRTNANAMGCLETKQGNLIFPVYSLINSECYCNTFYSLSEEEENERRKISYRMEVRAQVDIPAGAEITTRYICSFDCLPGRRNKIWQNWRFVCRCVRCSDPTDLGTHFSSLRCRACPTGYLRPSAPASISASASSSDLELLNPLWRCDGCDATVGPRHVTERLLDYERTMKVGFFSSRGDLEEYLSQEVHPNHFLICTLMQKRFFLRDGFDRSDESALEEMVRLGERLLRVVTTIDPGFTQRRGRILKVLAKDRMLLAKLRKERCELDENGFRGELRRAAAECKTMALCFIHS